MKKIIIIFFLTLIIADISDGIVLLPDFDYDTTILVDVNNEIIHTWEIDGLIKAYLNSDSTLYSISRNNNNDFLLQLKDWGGNNLWSYLLANNVCRLHHEQAITPNGNLLCLCRETISSENNLFFNEELNIDKIIEIEPVGNNEANIIWEWRFYDHLIQNQDINAPQYGNIAQNPQLLNIYAHNHYSDYTHINSIDFNVALNQIVISSRELNEIYIIDHSTTTLEAAGNSGGIYHSGGDILYRWGNPAAYNMGEEPSNMQLFAPHGINWVSGNFPGSGNLLVFHSPYGEFQSAIIEFQPPILNNGLYELLYDEPFGPSNFTWFYQSNFYSPSHSGAFRLPNGNTFITSFHDQQIFEVSSDGIIYWEYSGNHTSVHRSKKYTSSYFNSLVMGDLNYDNTVNILDVIYIVNVVLEEVLIDFRADLNTDDLINILDIIALVNLILGNRN